MRTAKPTFHAYSIIMHQQLSDKDMKEYFSTGVLPRHVYPLHCARAECPACLHFQRHDQFERTCVYHTDEGWTPSMWVQRFKCALCEKVFSFFIPGYFKWQRADHDLQQAVALGGHANEAVREAFSERTLKRWRHKWNRWTTIYQQLILTWLFTCHSTLSPDVSAQEARTSLRYLQSLLEQLTGNVLVAVAVTSAARFGGRENSEIPHFLSLVFP